MTDNEVKTEQANNVQRLQSALEVTIYLMGIGIVLGLFYYAYSFAISRQRFAILVIGPGLALFYLTRIQQFIEQYNGHYLSGSWRSRYAVVAPLAYAVIAVVAILATVYFHLNFDRLLYDALIQGYRTSDYVVAAAVILITVDATYRAFGKAIGLVIVLAALYAYLGPNLPGILYHSGLTPLEIVRYGALNMGGVFGFILGVGVTWVAIFIIFAGMAQAYGALDYIIKVGEEFSKRFRTGVAEFAVISSMIMGSITGSAAANTATTGSFTIPMLKNQGVRKDFAAAIESVASSGGQMLPPVMGVAAFLMADILGIPYLQVVQAGTIPALLFYLSVSVSVYLIVIKNGWVASQEGKFDTSVLWSGVHFVIPFGVLLYCLIIMKLTPLSAGLYTIFSLIPVMFIRDLIVEDTSLTTVRSTTEKTVTGMRDGAIDFAPLIGALAGIGFVIAMVEQTGLAQRISYSMVTFAGGSVFVLLIFAMIASILFGLGMPTPAAYLMVVVLIAPALTNAGIIELKAHIFVFYFAMLSAITPPVAVAVLIGARIAEADFLQACLQALRIGIAGFIIPFALVYNDGLIVWSYPATLISLGALLIGLLGITTAVIGFDGIRDIKIMWRVVIGAGGILALFGPGTIQYAGCVGVILLLVLSTRGVFETPRPTLSR